MRIMHFIVNTWFVFRQKNAERGEKAERKLCHFVESCSFEGFCITAKSARDPFPCHYHDSYTGSPIEIYYNGTLTARDLPTKNGRLEPMFFHVTPFKATIPTGFTNFKHCIPCPLVDTINCEFML